MPFVSSKLFTVRGVRVELSLGYLGKEGLEQVIVYSVTSTRPPLVSHWPHSHMATLNCKEGWEVENFPNCLPDRIEISSLQVYTVNIWKHMNLFTSRAITPAFHRSAHNCGQFAESHPWHVADQLDPNLKCWEEACEGHSSKAT